jgi:hypothetical protein
MVRIAMTIPAMKEAGEIPMRLNPYTMNVAVMHPVVPA